MIRRPGTPIATSIGRRNTSSTRAEKSHSSTPAKVSTSKSTALLHGYSTPPADRPRAWRGTIVISRMVRSVSSSGEDGWRNVRLGCRGAGPGAIRIHDVVSHRVPRLLDRTCQLSCGARGAPAVDRARGLHQPVQLLAEDLRRRVR